MSRSAHAHPHKVIACREYDILVPFVCHRCGNCCRKYEPIIELELLPEIAWTLGEPIVAIQDRLRVQGLSHSAGRPTDCCFLDPRHLVCMIYKVRPTDCRQFPPLDGVGAGAVDCPGHREYKIVLNAFTQHRECVHGKSYGFTRGQRQIPVHAHHVVRQTLEAARVSDGYRLVFEALNG
jgi:Fe-S-cluster containining protein